MCITGLYVSTQQVGVQHNYINICLLTVKQKTTYSMGRKKRATWYSFITLEKCLLILKTLALFASAVNLQQGSCHISDRTLNVSLHYLVNYKRSTIAILLYLDVFNSITDLLLNISICVLLNAHEHTLKDVCATRPLRHRWRFVPSRVRPSLDTGSLHRWHELDEWCKCMSVHAPMPKEVILAFNVTHKYSNN